MKHPESISKDELCRILHISKRKALWMLQNGIIPCEVRDTATHKYTIAMADVRAYQKRSVIQKRKEMPVGVFGASPAVTETHPELYLKLRGEEKERFARILHKEFTAAPDDLTVTDAAALIGYHRTTVLYHIEHRHIKGIRVNNTWHIPKSKLILFLTNDKAFGIKKKSAWHQAVITKYIESQMPSDME